MPGRMRRARSSQAIASEQVSLPQVNSTQQRRPAQPQRHRQPPGRVDATAAAGGAGPGKSVLRAALGDSPYLRSFRSMPHMVPAAAVGGASAPDAEASAAARYEQYRQVSRRKRPGLGTATMAAGSGTEAAAALATKGAAGRRPRTVQSPQASDALRRPRRENYGHDDRAQPMPDDVRPLSPGARAAAAVRATGGRVVLARQQQQEEAQQQQQQQQQEEVALDARYAHDNFLADAARRELAILAPPDEQRPRNALPHAGPAERQRQAAAALAAEVSLARQSFARAAGFGGVEAPDPVDGELDAGRREARLRSVAAQAGTTVTSAAADGAFSTRVAAQQTAREERERWVAGELQRARQAEAAREQAEEASRVADLRQRKQALLARKAQLQRQRRDLLRQQCASRIQAIFRGRTGRQGAMDLRNQHLAAASIQNKRRQQHAHRETSRRRRHHMQRQRALDQEHRAASSIQASRRGLVQRRHHAVRVQEHAAASSIQAHARRRVAMKAMVTRRAEDDEARRVRRMQAAVREQGGIPLLVALLRDGTPQARTNAAGALEQLAHANNDNQIAIREEGGIRLLVGLMRYAATGEQSPGSWEHGDAIFDAAAAEEAQVKAVRAIGALSADAGNRECVREDGALPLLAQLLAASSSSAALQEAIARCLWSLLLDPANQSALTTEGTHLQLVALINFSPALSLRSACAAALSQMVWQHRANQTAALEGGAAAALVGLLRLRSEGLAAATPAPEETQRLAEEAEARANAATAVQALCFANEPAQSRVREEGGIPLLVTMLNDTAPLLGSEAQREAAAAALWNLAIDDGARVAIGEEGGAPLVASLLVPLLDDGNTMLSDPTAKLNACRALRRMAIATEANRRAVRDAGAVPLLARMLVFGDNTARASASSTLVAIGIGDDQVRPRLLLEALRCTGACDFVPLLLACGLSHAPFATAPQSDFAVEHELANALEVLATESTDTVPSSHPDTNPLSMSQSALAESVLVPDVHTVRVRCACAKKLVATDQVMCLNAEGKMGRSSDPFLVLHCGDGENGIERRTKVAKRTRKPTWEVRARAAHACPCQSINSVQCDHALTLTMLFVFAGGARVFGSSYGGPPTGDHGKMLQLGQTEARCVYRLDHHSSGAALGRPGGRGGWVGAHR